VEARDFITKNKSKKVEPSSSPIFFPAYQNTIENINRKQRLDDDFLSFTFDDGYEIKNYTANRSLELGQKKAREIAIQSLKIEAIKIPETKDEKQFLSFMALQ
jgi:hypothetical protein